MKTERWKRRAQKLAKKKKQMQMSGKSLFLIQELIRRRQHVSNATCAICGTRFTEEEWDNRHSDGEEEYHERCCPICNLKIDWIS